MSNSNSIPATAPLIDPTKRQVLPISEAVRFKRRDWERSQTVREVLDSFTTNPPKPNDRYIDPAESIIMSGNEIQNTLRTGSHVVKQKRTVDLGTLPELSVVEPFAVVPDTTTRDDAAAALAALNERKPHARQGARLPRKPLKAPRTASPVWLTTVIVLGVLVAAAWTYIALYR